ncbi:POT family MFS transporter [Candidatus Woesearchaeota archaeon]|nr:POT family MFS transporter [Candidatus Woesearchaeota archaeon]
MNQSRYRKDAFPTTGLPPGIGYIIGNEAAERFSYYGMRAVLVVYMTQYLVNADGQPAPLSPEAARAHYHLFVSAAYFTPLLGALLSDIWLGKYRTIVMLSLVYCLGHLALSLDATESGLMLGQALIALGAGGIKPCVSAHLGDQFADTNRHRLSQAYGWFYWAINLGAFASMLITPWLLAVWGPGWAFGLPAVLMWLAILVFWAGRYRYAHVPPTGYSRFLTTLKQDGGLSHLARLTPVYLCLAVFWALFDQTGSSWVLQAQAMDGRVAGFTLLPSQIQAANPLFILLLTPAFHYGLYPLLARHVEVTAVAKISVGMVLAAASFALAAWIQAGIDVGAHPSILWQLAAYLLLTASEVMVSVTGLEFAYTQAPKALKSLVMSLFMVSVAVGNLLTALVNQSIQGMDHPERLAGAAYFWFFAGLMLLTTLIFAALAQRR